MYSFLSKELLESFNIWFKNWKGISREISIEEPDFKNFVKHVSNVVIIIIIVIIIVVIIIYYYLLILY